MAVPSLTSSLSKDELLSLSRNSILPKGEHYFLHSIDDIGSNILNDISSNIQFFKELADPEKCKEEYLPFLAHSFKVDFWDENLQTPQKRALIKQSLLLHKHKGTPWALEKIFEILGMEAKLKEWFEYEGDPYHFKIELFFKDHKISLEKIEELLKYIDIYKSARSVLDELSLGYIQEQKIKISSAALGEVSSHAIQSNYLKRENLHMLNSCMGETSSYARQSNYLKRENLKVLSNCVGEISSSSIQSNYLQKQDLNISNACIGEIFSYARQGNYLKRENLKVLSSCVGEISSQTIQI